MSGKMRITDKQFSEYTGSMFGVPFVDSVSDGPLTDYKKNRLTACFTAEEVVDQPEPPKAPETEQA